MCGWRGRRICRERSIGSGGSILRNILICTTLIPTTIRLNKCVLGVCSLILVRVRGQSLP
jgi:hypothetical protein